MKRITLQLVMGLMNEQEEQLRCFCARQPLLAKYGIRDGKPFVHIKIYKQQRVFGEMVLETGTIRIKCRDCFRWHKISIRKGKVSLESQRLEAVSSS